MNNGSVLITDIINAYKESIGDGNYIHTTAKVEVDVKETNSWYLPSFSPSTSFH